MAATLTADQLAKILGREAARLESSEITYEADLDEVIEGMFGRRWDEETFPSIATEFFRACMTGVLADNPDDEEVQVLWAVLRVTRSDTLRNKAATGLRNYLLDCSGKSNPRFKREVRNDLSRFGLFPNSAYENQSDPSNT